MNDTDSGGYIKIHIEEHKVPEVRAEIDALINAIGLNPDKSLTIKSQLLKARNDALQEAADVVADDWVVEIILSLQTILPE